MGAWIEMTRSVVRRLGWRSLPSWERGLKLKVIMAQRKYGNVAPFMGAWIEIAIILASLTEPSSRSLHGSVD